jgi:ABC-2 type transport system permease protein
MAAHNLRTVVQFEFLRTVRKRAFWAATLFVPVMIAIVVLLIVVSNSSTGKSAEAQKSAQFSFSYTDASGLVDTSITRRLGGHEAASTQAGIAAVRAGKVDAFFAYPADPATQTIRVYGADQGVFANGKYASVAQAILQASVEQKIGSAQLTAISQGNLKTTTITYQDGQVPTCQGELRPAAQSKSAV